MKKVTYTKILGGFFLITSLGIIFMCLSIGALMPMISGGVIFLMSVLYLSNPFLTYNDDQIEQKNLWGMTLRTYYFATDSIYVQDKSIYAKGKRLKLSSFLLVPSEYQALLDHVREKEVEKSKVKSGSTKTKHNDELLDSDL